MFIAILGYLV